MNVTVTISGEAWSADPIGSDPLYEPDDLALARVQASATTKPWGKGSRVTLEADHDDLLRLARWYDEVGAEKRGSGWGDEAGPREGRAMQKAAEKIREAVQEAVGGAEVFQAGDLVRYPYGSGVVHAVVAVRSMTGREVRYRVFVGTRYNGEKVIEEYRVSQLIKRAEPKR